MTYTKTKTIFLQIVPGVFSTLKFQVDQVEMEDWKTKSNKMTMELNELKAQYKELENKVIFKNTKKFKKIKKAD